MALLSLLTKKPPTLGKGDMTITFDAVLEDTLEAEVQLSDYPIEVGSISNDHRIKLPVKWVMTGGISNNPVKISATDFTGALSEVVGDNGLISTTAGYMAGWLKGDDPLRSSEALTALLNLMYQGEPFTVETGDYALSNMVIQKIRRTKDASNENGLIFIAELREWQDITTTIIDFSAKCYPDLSKDESSAITNKINKGLKSIKDAGDSINDTVNGWFS